jgi:hypothetical protein
VNAFILAQRQIRVKEERELNKKEKERKRLNNKALPQSTRRKS